ncbi:MgtC/SapB family protein [Paludibacterium paludis]|uniref:Protein MgtC n=1 Tax=Paludibacterium paludis TaxID=1225769 RepID=A0A918UBB2_9NEIS|nr:MgtC/SapB family protein [Paludibacterium paludis]GGY22386.1 methyltransferase [Paludibacterium paludis]
MHALFNFDFAGFLDSLVRLAIAFLLGTTIGYERQYRQRTAGLRTNALVAVGAAVFVDLAHHLNGAAGAVHVTAYVVSGVGFLGAGTIMKEGQNVRGLNTAATLWGSAAVGACAGADLFAEALLAALFVLAANTLLRPMVNSINRRPINARSSEITYQLTLIVDDTHQKEVLAELDALLDEANYPLADLDVEPFGDDGVEITATLMSSSADSRELDRIAEIMVGKDHVRQAYWNPGATE